MMLRAIPEKATNPAVLATAASFDPSSELGSEGIFDSPETHGQRKLEPFFALAGL